MTSDESNTGHQIIDIDQDKMNAWKNVKGDYQVDPNADEPKAGGENPSGVGAPASAGPNDPDQGESLGDTGTQDIIEDLQTGAGENEDPQS